ncbi:MAG: hypothetical protein H6618_05260 [Deltaproteobacteria bacterium]|nr:hypothetical protein [Deltaproteobacteria bacterium]
MSRIRSRVIIRKRQRKNTRWSMESGVSLLEMIIVIGLMGLLLSLSTAVYVNLDLFTGRYKSRLSARNEALQLIAMIRRRYNIDLIKEDDPARKVGSKSERIEGKIMDKSGDMIQGVLSVINTISTVSENKSVDLMTITNGCVELPDHLKNQIPMFNQDYFHVVFDQLRVSDSYSDASSSPGITDFATVQTTCEEYLQGFQCGYNSVPFISFDDGKRGLQIPADMTKKARFTSVRESAVAAFICDTESFGEADLRLFKDITVFIATFDMSKKNHPDPAKRLHWQKFRSIFSVSSPSENVEFISDKGL